MNGMNTTILYTTGEFAKRAGVTIRTIRYYDKVGLLTPTFVAENGYRQYTDQDYIKLQKIMSLKQLGFSLEEIYPLVIEDNQEAFANSIDLQVELINKRMHHLQLLKDSLKSTKRLVEQDQVEWNGIIELIKLSNKDELIAEDYKSTKNLDARIKLHDQCSIAEKDWFSWLYEEIDFSRVNRLLEVGCGNGQLWKKQKTNARNREIYLSDISEGMMDEVKNLLGDDFSYFVINCEQIPFKTEQFDTVIANHVLFYLRDVNKGVREIARVLKPKGILYCSTYSGNHMKEINELVHEFDASIELSEDTLYENFGFENGQEILEKQFANVELRVHEDALVIKEASLLYEYIVSCYGNQNEVIGNRLSELKQFLEEKIEERGEIRVTKEAGIYVCRRD